MIKKFCKLLHELIFKDIKAEVQSVKQRISYWLNPKKYPLNPHRVKVIKNEPVNVLVMIPGVGGDASRFTSLARKIEEKIPYSMFTVDYRQMSHNPVPIEELHDTIQEIEILCAKQGVDLGQIILIGESLGALIASKYVWRFNHGYSIPMVISVAGRQRYLENEFAFFCKDIRPEIEKTYSYIQQWPQMAQLFTIHGDRDHLVPRESAHIEESHSQLNVEGTHQGTLYNQKAEEQIVKWLHEHFNVAL